MADGISKDEMTELFEKFFGGAGGGGAAKPTFDLKNVEEFKKQIKESTEEMKKSMPLKKQVESLMRGQKTSVSDITKELETLDKQIEDLSKTAKTSADREKVYQVQQERNQKAYANANMQGVSSLQNFAVNMTSVAGTLLKGALDFAKDLQSGASGVDTGVHAAQTAARATGDAVSSAGQMISSLGPLVGMFAKKIPYLGPALTLFGAAVEMAGKKTAQFGEEAVKFLGDELKNTTKAFKDITSAGAVFGGGMTEMRNVAASAGLNITQLASVVKSSKEDLIGMGLGMGEATKRIAGVSKELRTGDLGMQLRKLGYSTEEQAELAASVSARLSAAGDVRVRSDADVAKMTAQYGKDLKVLSDVTGQDAKKAMEKARMQAQEQDLLAEAMAKGGPEAVKKLENQLASMPEAMKKGYMEFVSTGGTAIADAATNVAITQNPKLMEQYRKQYQDLQDNNVDASAAMRRTLAANEDTYKYARDNAAATKEVAIAARMTGNQLARGATDINNSMILGAARQRKGAAAVADANADLMSQNMAPLDVAVAGLEEDTQRLRSAMGEELTGAVTTFAEGLKTGVQTVDQALKEVGLSLQQKGKEEKFGEVAGGAAGGLAAGAIGAGIGSVLLPGVGTIIGGMLGSAVGGWLGSKGGGAVGSMFDEPPKKFAEGGIAEGPTRAIIGEAGLNEAVVPLPNGRSIPVNMDMSKIGDALKETLGLVAGISPLGRAATAATGAVQSMFSGGPSTENAEQLALLREIKEVLTASQGLQEQFVQNTYQ